ncbi:MAG: ABC transporter permease [Elusimicrobiota bacterium]
MNIAEAARAAGLEILAHKVRSALSLAAISVGAASLLYTLAQTRGMQEATQRNLELMGPGALSVERRRHYEGRGLSKGLTIADADAIRREIPGLFMVSPTASTWNADMRFEGRRVDDARVVGVTPEWRKRDWVYRLRGRFIRDEDVREAARVAVVVEPGGWVVKPFWAKFWSWKSQFDGLVGRRDVLGSWMRLGGHDFLVVGAMRLPPHDKDPRWSSWDNPSVIVPLSAVGRYLSPDTGWTADTVDAIKVDAGSEGKLPEAKRLIEALLKVRHRGEEDFEVKNLRKEVEDSIREESQYVVVALALGVVALLSGGIGILNVTLAAVYSRVREIGIRRAVGASRGDVMALFLVEAALLGLAGGAVGVLLGIVLIEDLARGAHKHVAALAWYHAAEMIALSAAVAAAFAAYPAWHASMLDPLDALREEP